MSTTPPVQAGPPGPVHAVLPGPDATPPPAPAAPKLWTVGTLTYTTAGLVILFSWLLWGDFAWSMKERSVSPVVQLLLKKFGSSDKLAGLFMGTLPGVIGLMLGPVVSVRSDRHRSRWGRRIPFLLFSTPFAVLAMAGLAFSPRMGGWLHAVLGSRSYGLGASVLLCFGLSWTLFEVATIIGAALIGALVNDVVPHAVIGRFYAMFRALSLLAGIIFNHWLFGKAETHASAIFLGIGALYGIGFITMCLKVKEGGYPPPPPGEPGGGTRFLRSAKAYFQECFGHSYYLWLFAANALGTLALSPINMFNVFFSTSVHMSQQDFGDCIAVSYGTSLVLSYFIGWLTDRFHPLRMGLAVQAIYAVAVLWGGLFVHDARTFGWALIAHTIISGAWLTSVASLGQRLLPKARYGQYASAMGLVVTLTSILLGPLLGTFLDHVNHVYRYSYLLSFWITLLAFGAGLVVYRKFVALGGVTHYAPPE